MVHFEVYLPDGRVELFDFDKHSLTVGRAPGSDIHIQVSGISRMHARVERTRKGRWLLVDLDSRNHVYLHGKRIKSHVLTNGNVIMFGSVKAVFHDPSGASDKPSDKAEQLTHLQHKQEKEEPVCPSCLVPLSKGTEICVNCGYNLKTGTHLRTRMVQENSAATREKARRFRNGLK